MPDNRKQPLRIVIINKSDSTGGAAVVSRRLMEALRCEGADARMLVVEKLTDSPFVEIAASQGALRRPFIIERLKIFISNGFNRSTLFKIDTGSEGLPLWEHPLVKNADVVLLNWINQGMLSLSGVSKILMLGKPVVWTMHDMWCMTGVCHHAGECQGYKGECRECMLLGRRALEKSLARKIWMHKKLTYSLPRKIKFVAVSSWLKDKAGESSLLWKQKVSVIPNAFEMTGCHRRRSRGESDVIRIGFGAARLDDPVKGLPVLVRMTQILKKYYPEIAGRLEIVTYGGVKHPGALSGMELAHRHLGMVRGEEALKEMYGNLDIIVSSSSYETLPGTLVEAQAYGCIPVSFDRGGQSDIIDHLSTGYLAKYSGTEEQSARNLAEGIAWAVECVGDKEKRMEIIEKMCRNVEKKFSASSVAKAYLALISGD